MNGPAVPPVAIRIGQRLLDDGKITQGQLDEALAKQKAWGSTLGTTLVGLGHVKAFDLYQAVAGHYGLRFIDLRAEPPDDSLLDPADRVLYVAEGFLPWRRDGGKVMVATMNPAGGVDRWARATYGAGGYALAVTSKFDILWHLQKTFSEADSHEAREGLFSRTPEHSAKITLDWKQVIAVYALVSAVIFGLALAPRATLIAVAGFVSLLYLLTFLFKFLLTWVGANRRIDVQVRDEEVAALDDASLPVFTILVPMYKEAEVLPLLTRSIRELDYPKSKLDVKLVLEAGDDETIDAAKALAAASIFEIIRVPPSQPKTKPKACNYALRFAAGEYLCIFDAEDLPEPDQLKKVVAAFRKAPPDVSCIQARLNYFNRDDNFLTRMFTLEYSQWFDFLLPGLHALRVPIPLGGTSNHFKTRVLRDLGAWDPYNVTEDADLGVRLTQQGHRVGIVNSTTFEEANGVLPSWIKQRSRWVKGYMQTYLVHMRRPVALYRSLGHSGFWGFQFFIGGPPLTMLINPLLWLIFLATLFFPVDSFSEILPGPILYMALFNLLVANLMYVYFGIVAAFKRRYYDLVPYGLLQPLYWVLHSIAAYKAAWQLVFAPHYWEKTQHGTSSATQKALAATRAENALAAAAQQMAAPPAAAPVVHGG